MFKVSFLVTSVAVSTVKCLSLQQEANEWSKRILCTDESAHYSGNSSQDGMRVVTYCNLLPHPMETLSV